MIQPEMLLKTCVEYIVLFEKSFLIPNLNVCSSLKDKTKFISVEKSFLTNKLFFLIKMFLKNYLKGKLFLNLIEKKDI